MFYNGNYCHNKIRKISCRAICQQLLFTIDEAEYISNKILSTTVEMCTITPMWLCSCSIFLQVVMSSVLHRSNSRFWMYSPIAIRYNFFLTMKISLVYRPTVLHPWVVFSLNVNQWALRRWTIAQDCNLRTRGHNHVLHKCIYAFYGRSFMLRCLFNFCSNYYLNVLITII